MIVFGQCVPPKPLRGIYLHKPTKCLFARFTYGNRNIEFAKFQHLPKSTNQPVLFKIPVRATRLATMLPQKALR